MDDKVLLKLNTYLEKNKYKPSKVRNIIVAEIFKIHGHFDLKDLNSDLKKKYKDKISRATIFRTVAILQDAKMIQKIFIDNNVLYEHTYGHEHHDHLICRECGQIIEINNKELERLQALICKKYGFQEESHTLQVYGKCKKCIVS